jgi:hypothetical protein
VRRAGGQKTEEKKKISPQRHKDHTKGHKEDRNQRAECRRCSPQRRQRNVHIELLISFVPFVFSAVLFYLFLLFALSSVFFVALCVIFVPLW